MALGIEAPHLDDGRLTPLGAAELGAGTRAVIAAGTGLGMAMILDDGSVLPSEGGHAPFAPADSLEQEVLSVLAARLGYVCWEDVLSGPGLGNLHAAVSSVWGSGEEHLEAAQIVQRAVEMTDPVCHQSLGMYCDILGSAAGALCVTSGAVGGIYLGGGIPPRLAEFLSASGFRARFEERGRMSEYVASVATMIIMDDEAGLAGATRYARSLVGS